MSEANAYNYPGILETIQALGETTLIVDPAQIVALCRTLKTKENFVRLDSITAVDWYPAEPRYELVYHLHSLGPDYLNKVESRRLRLKCKVSSVVSGVGAEIDSVTGVWRCADWYEREVFDMFGVGFRNHPNLRRILMPLDWEGHPLRKDYPVHGYKYSYAKE